MGRKPAVFGLAGAGFDKLLELAEPVCGAQAEQIPPCQRPAEDRAY